MAKLVCTKCGCEKPVPKVHDGPGVPSKKDTTKIACPAHGDRCPTVNIPQCCGTPMKLIP